MPCLEILRYDLFMWSATKRLIEADGLRPGARVHERNGIRGGAAVTVVLYHLIWETFGHLFPWIKNHVTATFINGKFVVCIFYILSGETLSAGYFGGKGNRSVARLSVWRYFRLTIPILAATLTILGALQTENDLQPAGWRIYRVFWLARRVASFPTTLDRMIKYALFDVY